MREGAEVSPAVMREAELRMWIDALGSRDWRMRLLAGEKVCELTGVLEAVRGLAPGGALRPAPSWPQVDIVPQDCRVDADGRWLLCGVRTLVHGVPLVEEVRVKVPLADGALMEAVDRGRDGLARRML